MRITGLKSISILEKSHQNLLKTYKSEKIYYCPFCKSIMYNGNYSVKLEDGRKWFKCIDCNNSYFNNSTAVEKHSGIKYHLKGDSTCIAPIISDLIINLHKEGFSINEIHALTHFSKELIRKKLSKIKTRTYNKILSAFMEKTLKIDKESCQSVEQICALSLKEKVLPIQKAFTIGCKYDLIVEIFKVSKRDVTKIINDYEKTLNDDVLNQIYSNRNKYTYTIVEKNNMLYLKTTTEQYH